MLQNPLIYVWHEHPHVLFRTRTMSRKPRPMRAGHCRPFYAGTSDNGRSFVLSKGYDGMPRPTTPEHLCWSKGNDGMPRPMPSDRVCCPRTMMACQTRRRPTVSPSQKAMMAGPPDIVRPCVLPKGDDDMPCRTSFDRLCYPKSMMACHARRHSSVCASQRR